MLSFIGTAAFTSILHIQMTPPSVAVSLFISNIYIMKIYKTILDGEHFNSTDSLFLEELI